MNDTYNVILGWMRHELGLKGNELSVYALIYGFSQDGVSEFRGSYSYIQNATELSKNTVISVLKSLIKKGYIKRTQTSCYVAVPRSKIVFSITEVIPEVGTVDNSEVPEVGTTEEYQKLVQAVPEVGTVAVPEVGTNIYNNIYINKNNNIYTEKVKKESEERFKIFWEEFPSIRKISKEKCRIKFCSFNPELQEKIIQDVISRKKLDQKWISGYNPGSPVYLNQKRWDDSYQTMPANKIVVAG